MAKGTKPGLARSPGVSVQALLQQEQRPVPVALREVAYDYLGSEDIAKERYYSREFHQLEVERMWSKVWQMACREEEIPNVGDHIIYDIANYSLIVVRTGEHEIKAYHNACLHRGRMLREAGGNVSQFQCPFHGFTWRLDGALKWIPCRWDFPHIKDKDFSLPEAKVGTWGGFVFVNLDPQCRSLQDYLSDLPAHFIQWDFEHRYKLAHVAKVVAMNWKVGVEAFIESLHVLATHPAIMPSTADTNTQYDVRKAKPHYNRMITAMASPSPHLEGRVTEQAIWDAVKGQVGASRMDVQLPEGLTAREFAADIMRARMHKMTNGVDFSDATDSEMLDAIQYYVFPNFFPWGGYGPNIIYRFRPHNNDPEQALMEVMFLAPVPKDKPRPTPAPMHLLGPDEKWADARELGLLGAVFDQDMSNMPFVQKGLRAAYKPGLTLANYQESRIRHLHRTLDMYIAGKVDANGVNGHRPKRQVHSTTKKVVSSKSKRK
jgi:phenylpropionate dioxygenase-like ring-hydroxylating dioxygenase large terminal subunit